jgi:hypothetical protein
MKDWITIKTLTNQEGRRKIQGEIKHTNNNRKEVSCEKKQLIVLNGDKMSKSYFNDLAQDDVIS